MLRFIKKRKYEWAYLGGFIRYRNIYIHDDGGMLRDYYFEVYITKWWRPWRKWEHAVTVSNYQIGRTIAEDILKEATE